MDNTDNNDNFFLLNEVGNTPEVGDTAAPLGELPATTAGESSTPLTDEPTNAYIVPELAENDSYTCTNCAHPIDIFKINDKDNTITFKCLKPKPCSAQKTIPLSEYLKSMKQYTFLYNKCSICGNEQNKFKETPLYLYCTKCDAIICTECLDKHFEQNKNNHPDNNVACIIKNTLKNTNCTLHPNQKNYALCLRCNRHICVDCMITKQHVYHKKNNIIEVEVADDLKAVLNGIINFYEVRLGDLKREIESKENELLNNQDENIKKKLEELRDEYNKTKDLSLINQLLRNAQEKYPDNYYYNNNIHNVIYRYYDSKEDGIRKLITKDIYTRLFNKEKEELENPLSSRKRTTSSKTRRPS